MATCHCEGFVDQWSHTRGHHTITVHDEDCPNAEPDEDYDDSDDDD